MRWSLLACLLACVCALASATIPAAVIQAGFEATAELQAVFASHVERAASSPSLTATALDYAAADALPMRDADVFAEMEALHRTMLMYKDYALKGVSCESCKAVAGEVARVSKDTVSLDKLIKAVATGCGVVFITNPEAAKTCKAVTGLLLGLLPKLTDALLGLDWEPEAFCSFVVPVCTIDCCEQKERPEQIHLALDEDSDAMTVSWVSLAAPANASYVIYCPADTPQAHCTGHAAAEDSTYTAGGWRGTIHHAKMTGLEDGQRYQYQVVSGLSASPFFTFTQIDKQRAGTSAQHPLRVAQIADLDYSSHGAATVRVLTDAVLAGKVDLVLFVGDIGYADGYEKHWDVFMRVLQPIAARVPVMVSPGNHELLHGFVAYQTRFRMPGYQSTKNMRYAFRVGALHVTSMNSESPLNTPLVGDEQRRWLADTVFASQDYKQATWRFAAHHRPMYCTTHAGKVQCGLFAELLRKSHESLLTDAGIDVHFSGHQHGYERTHPVKDGKAYPPAPGAPNAAPVYIVGGGSGNREGTRTVSGDEPWSAYGSTQKGFVYAIVAGKQLHVQYVDCEMENVIDDVTYVKA